MVLVVDDNVLVLETLVIELNRHGFEVLAEADPRRALEILMERNDIVALICDFQMPEINGAQVAHAAKQRDPAMLVLILSSSENPDLTASPWDQWLQKGRTSVADIVLALRSHSIDGNNL